MDGILYFFLYALYAAEAIILVPPAPLLMALGLFGALVLVKRYPAVGFREAILWSSTQLFVPAAILVVGVLLRWEGPDDANPPRWPVDLISGLLWGHLPITGLLVLFLNRVRWFVLVVSLVVFAYSLGAACVSSMSVTGDWL
jgi:hypothetical protein